MEGFPENYADLKKKNPNPKWLQCNSIYIILLNDNIMGMEKRLVVVWGSGRLGNLNW